MARRRATVAAKGLLICGKMASLEDRGSEFHLSSVILRVDFYALRESVACHHSSPHRRHQKGTLLISNWGFIRNLHNRIRPNLKIPSDFHKLYV